MTMSKIIITESGSNKRAQFGSSSSYNYGNLCNKDEVQT